MPRTGRSRSDVADRGFRSSRSSTPRNTGRGRFGSGGDGGDGAGGNEGGDGLTRSQRRARANRLLSSPNSDHQALGRRELARLDAAKSGTFAPPKAGERASGGTTAGRFIESMLPSGASPGLAGGITAFLGGQLADAARRANLEVDTGPRGRPAEGRDGGDDSGRQTLGGGRRFTPAAGDAPITGATDEEAGEGSEILRRTRRVLGAANIRRPALTPGGGRTFLGR